MGNYVDEARILKLMPQLPKAGASGYSNTSDMIELAIEKSESIIDSRLASKYSLPLSTVPPLVRHLADELSLYFLYQGLYSSDNVAHNEYAEDYRRWEKNAFSTLKNIQNENIFLTLTDGSLVTTKPSSRSIKSSSDAYTPVFNMDDPHQWGQDQDRLDAIADERS